jgi:hypothetical protein
MGFKKKKVNAGLGGSGSTAAEHFAVIFGDD